MRIPYTRTYKKLMGHRTREGFTMIELILYLMVTTAVLLVMTNSFTLMFESRVRNQTISGVEEEGARAMQTIAQAIRNAQSITAPVTGATSSALSVALASSTRNPTVVSLSASNTLQMAEGGSPGTSLTANNIVASGLVFSNLSAANTPGIIRIEFTLSKTVPFVGFQYTYTKTFYGSATLR